ncbi:MAG: class I SAM-dependent methyltransferase [Terriglobales bacterium]
MNTTMWHDYEAAYREALQDPEFLAWRELGAQRKADNIVRVCRGLNPASVIEIGCGTGAVLRRLHTANFAREYFCTDLSPSAIAYVRASCPAFAASAMVGQAEALSYPDGAFDLAILSHVIEHMQDPLGALREASRIARFVAVEVPTEKVAVNLIRTKLLRRPYPSIAGAGHVQFWSPRSIAGFLKNDAGFEILARHQDLLNRDEEADAARFHPGLAQQALKRSLRRLLPAALFARVFTTHAAFLCSKPQRAAGVPSARRSVALASGA